MKKVIILAALAAILTISSIAQVGPTGSTQTYPYGSDPCQNSSIAKLPAAVSITTATTTEVVAASAGKKVWVCGFTGSLVGTSATVQFEYGTKTTTACDTGATVLSGALQLPSTAKIISTQQGFSLLVTPASQEICLVTTGTGINVSGTIQYVQGAW
jgi:hypothetical protein